MTVGKKTNNCRKTKMLWLGRPNSYGSWRPEDNILKCGMKGKQLWLMTACIPSRSLRSDGKLKWLTETQFM